jgi:fructose-bisphosphate aldolase class II
MPLAAMGDITGPARAAGRGVGAFNVIGIEHAEAIVAGAEAAAAPVVLQVSENCVAYHRGLAPIGSACLALARGAAVPVAVHLDHAADVTLVEAAAGLGFGSVMFDASRLPYADNVRATADVVRSCHRRGIWVEAELGEIGGKDGVHSPLARTDPGEAASFVAATGVDALAVAVGSSHAMATRDAVLDLDLIARLHGAVGVPLVLHGSSGVPDQDLAAAVRAGMTKINIATQLNKVFTVAVRLVLSADPATVDPRKYAAAGRDAIASEVARLLRLLGTGSTSQDTMEETAGGREPAANTGARAGGAGEPLSPVE